MPHLEAAHPKLLSDHPSARSSLQELKDNGSRTLEVGTTDVDLSGKKDGVLQPPMAILQSLINHPLHPTFINCNSHLSVARTSSGDYGASPSTHGMPITSLPRVRQYRRNLSPPILVSAKEIEQQQTNPVILGFLKDSRRPIYKWDARVLSDPLRTRAVLPATEPKTISGLIKPR